MSYQGYIGMVAKEIVEGIEFVQEYLKEHDVFIVAVHEKKVISEKMDSTMQSFLELINEVDSDFFKCYIGTKYMGKAEALLIRYINAKGVYVKKGTTSGIATLIVGAIPNQVDHLVTAANTDESDENKVINNLVKSVDDPTEAFDILSSKLMIEPMNKS